MSDGIPRATPAENAAFIAAFLLPGLLRGTVTTARPGHTVTNRLGTLGYAHRLTARLRERYGGRPVLVRGLAGPTLLVLSGEDVREVLSASDEVYSLAAPEKLKGLAPFLDGTLLLSTGAERRERAAFVGEVLGSAETAHRMADRFAEIAAEEAATLVPGVVTYDRLDACWNRVARRCLYGDAARDDHELSRVLARLRLAGNWAGLRGRAQARLSARYDELITGHLLRAEPGSLAALAAATPRGPATSVVRQAAFWLMGFTVPTPALMQSLALLASFPCPPARLRGCLLEGLRLWAPVPVLVRTTTRDTDWYGDVLPAGTSVLIPLILHARDSRLGYAHTFSPGIWDDGTAEREWLLGPFSRGDGQCKGMNLALHVATAFLAELLRRATPELEGRPLPPRLPLMLDTLKLRIVLREAAR